MQLKNKKVMSNKKIQPTINKLKFVSVSEHEKFGVSSVVILSRYSNLSYKICTNIKYLNLIILFHDIVNCMIKNSYSLLNKTKKYVSKVKFFENNINYSVIAFYVLVAIIIENYENLLVLFNKCVSKVRFFENNINRIKPVWLPFEYAFLRGEYRRPRGAHKFNRINRYRYKYGYKKRKEKIFYSPWTFNSRF